ncbi:MAG: DUF5663 domain-containing protein [Candidatus Saccharibacteria bacterium]|nr:DUF5663 domain-containing protein [Candidatus Saccharibacteria bacterium]
MNEYLVDRETLGQFVDALIAQKYQDQPVPNFEALREDEIKKLDDRIGKAVFGNLTEVELAEINSIIDSDEDDEARVQEFFDSSSINLQQVIQNTLLAYKREFLGGENA